MLRRHRERPQSSPGPIPRSGRPPATTCLPAQTPVLFSTSLTQLLTRRVLTTTQNFLTPNPPKKLSTSTLPTSAHTSLNKLSGSLVVLSVVATRTIYARTNAQIHPSTTLSAPLHHQGTYNCYFQTLNFHCLRSRPHSLSSSNTSPPFSLATSSLPLQLVLVFLHLSLMLETCHHYPHKQARKTCRLSNLLLSSNFFHLLYLQTLWALDY